MHRILDHISLRNLCGTLLPCPPMKLYLSGRHLRENFLTGSNYQEAEESWLIGVLCTADSESIAHLQFHFLFVRDSELHRSKPFNNLTFPGIMAKSNYLFGWRETRKHQHHQNTPWKRKPWLFLTWFSEVFGEKQTEESSRMTKTPLERFKDSFIKILYFWNKRNFCTSAFDVANHV